MPPSADQKLKLIVIWALLLPLAAFVLSIRDASSPVSLSILPQVPREDRPVVATFKLTNPEAEERAANYRFYTNGNLLMAGTTILPPLGVKQFQYVYPHPVPTGHRVTFTIHCEMGEREIERMSSSPPFPPQALSSFMSFAAFSSTVMSSMVTADYYTGSFGGDTPVNAGLALSITLIILLIFLELTGTAERQNESTRLGKLTRNFNLLTWVLLAIFTGMVYTRIIMILAA